MAFVAARQFGDNQACSELTKTLGTVKGVENIHIQGKDVVWTVHDLNAFFEIVRESHDLNWIEYSIQMEF